MNMTARESDRLLAPGESTGNAPLALADAMALLEDSRALIDYMAEALKVKTRPPTFDRITKALASYHGKAADGGA